MESPEYLIHNLLEKDIYHCTITRISSGTQQILRRGGKHFQIILLFLLLFLGHLHFSKNSDVDFLYLLQTLSTFLLFCIYLFFLTPSKKNTLARVLMKWFVP